MATRRRRNVQHWVWGKKRGRKNLERVQGQWGILHDTGFSGDHTYKPVKIGDKNEAILSSADTFYKRSEALAWIKEHADKTNPKRSRNTGTTVPAHVRINPRTGRIQVFVTPKVAETLRGGKGLRVAGNPNEPVYSVGTTQIPYAAHGLTQKQAVTYLKKYPMDSLGFWNSIYKKQPDGSYKKINVKKKR